MAIDGTTAAEGRYFKRNFTLGVINGTLVNFGMAFMDPFTILPVFILRLGASDFIVGIASAISGAGWFFPQAFVSRIAEARRYLLNIYRTTTAMRVLAWGGVALSVCYLDPTHTRLYLLVFISFYVVANLGAGLAAVPFLEISSKTIPVTSRGMYFGTRRFLGGVLGILAGALVSIILHSGNTSKWMGEPVYALINRFASALGLIGHGFPINFGILFLIGGGLVSIGLIVFCFVGEPPAPQVHEPERLMKHLFSGFSLLKGDRNYRNFYLVRICWQFTAMAFPFYTRYAYKDLGLSENVVGVYVSLWIGSAVLSNYIWGQIMDRKGNKLVLIITAALSVIPPATILILDGIGAGTSTPITAAVFFAASSTFFINGFIRSGRVISNMTYLLEFAPLEKRPLYVGFMNSFSFPFMLSPAIGGLILRFSSIRVLFSIAFFFALMNLVMSTRLREPRAS